MSLVTALQQRLGNDHVAVDADMSPFLHSMVYTGDRDRDPACVVRPHDFDQVSQVLAVCAEHGSPVTVVGGGHGPRNVANGVPCLDLRSIPPTVSAVGTEVTINGSARVSDLLSWDSDRVVPVGVAPTPGVGLLTMGGVGGLTRSLGLSIDSLAAATILTQDGQRVSVGPEGDPDLWWAVRGAASALGVVESATFRTHAVPKVVETRVLTRARVLEGWITSALASPRTTSMSWIMVPGETPGDVLLYFVEVSTASAIPRSLAVVPTAEVMSTATVAHAYRDFLDFNVPTGPGLRPAAPADPRWKTAALWINGEKFGEVLPELAQAVAEAPTPWCRVDFQHLGGALGDVDDTATALWGRRAEGNLVISPTWDAHGPEALKTQCIEWLTRVETLVAPATIGRYASDLTADAPDCDTALFEVFGDNLARLESTARSVDPHRRFRFAPPFSEIAA